METTTNECHTLGGSTGLGLLRHARAGAASLVLDNGRSLWVTGGRQNSDETTIWSSEILSLGLDPSLISSYGPDLPIAGLKHHCLEMVGPKVAILIGGLLHHQADIPSRRTWSISPNRSDDTNEYLMNMVWNELAPLGAGRTNHVCGALKDLSVPGTRIVLVAGGRTLAGWLGRTVEQLIITNIGAGPEETVSMGGTHNWEVGPDSPTPIVDATSATTADQGKLLILGGQTAFGQDSSSLLEIQCSMLQCLWKKTSEELAQPSSNGLALIFPAGSDVMAFKSRVTRLCAFKGS